MPRFLVRARFAAILAAGLGLLITGVAAGAAGSALIIGSESNNAGTSNTSLTTSSTVVAFRLLQNGAGGTALMGYVTPTTGPARGVYGRVDSPDGWGVQARNNAATSGSGAAIQAIGVNNHAIVATSDATTAIRGTGSCSGFCGAYGVEGIGDGLGAGVHGDGSGAIAGVFGESPFWGLYGYDSSGDGSGLALQATGDVTITGDLDVSGVCTGCASAALGINGGTSSLAAGDAVTIRGSKEVNGRVFLVVEKAKAGDTVLGLMAKAVTATSREIVMDGDEHGLAWKYQDAGKTSKKGGSLVIVTSGVLEIASADASGGAIAVGDALTVGSKAGKLVKKGADGTVVGYALGKLADGSGTVAVYVDPR
jgi:hypothetical protein